MAAEEPRGLRRRMTRARSMMGKPSAAVNSRQPAGMVLRDSGAMARPARAAMRREPEVSHSKALRQWMPCWSSERMAKSRHQSERK